MARTLIREIVILGLPTWDGVYEKAAVQLARRLAGRVRVLYVEYPPTHLDLLRRSRPGRADAGGMASCLGQLGARLRVPPEAPRPKSLYVLTPPAQLPINGLPEGRLYDTLRRAGERSVRAALRRACRQIGFTDYALLNAFWPQMGADRPRCWWGESRRFYFSYDDIGGVPWNARHGVELEKRWVASSDGVIATSPALADRAQTATCSSRVALVPNGADTALLARALDPSLPAAPELGALPEPRIAFVGNLDHRVDFPLLTQVARLRPWYGFVFVGQVWKEETVSDLRGLPNVVFLAPRPQRDLPPVLRGVQVGLVPFVKNRFTECINPIKLYEYLAAGLPVVLTDFSPRPGETEPLCHVAPPGDAEAFAAAMDRAVAEAGSPGLVRERTALAARADWSARADQMLESLERFSKAPLP